MWDVFGLGAIFFSVLYCLFCVFGSINRRWQGTKKSLFKI